MAVPSAAGTAASAPGRGPLGALDSQPWVEKYRPKTLDDVAAHKDIIDTSEQPAAHARCFACHVRTITAPPRSCRRCWLCVRITLQVPYRDYYISSRAWAICTKLVHVYAHSAVKRLVGENKLPHLLFYGPPGTGKTSTILAVARQIYGASFQSMVLELNASDDRGIGVVRQQVQDFASSRTLFGCVCIGSTASGACRGLDVVHRGTNPWQLLSVRQH